MRTNGVTESDKPARSAGRRVHLLRVAGLAGLVAAMVLQAGHVQAKGDGKNPMGASTTAVGGPSGGPINGTITANSFVVNTTLDTLACSKVTTLPLRCAIRDATATTATGPISITFNIPSTDSGCKPQVINGQTVNVCTIKPISDFPALYSADTTINGYSQPGAVPNSNPMGSPDNAILTVQIDGTNDSWDSIKENNDGLLIYGARDTVEGLSVTNFPNTNAAYVGTGIRTTNTSAVISGDWLGVSPTGVVGGSDLGAAVVGAGSTVGGTARAARNVISGNNYQGLDITSSGNKVQGNYIGTDPTGTAAMGNGTLGASSGISLIGSSANNNLIGGTGSSARNIISANSNAGIGLGASVGSTISDNFIGTNAAGTAALPNATDGIFGQGAANNTIGGTVAGTANIISGNKTNGIELAGGSGNHVQGNIVGLSSAHSALANGANGVFVHGGEHGDVIGGTVTGSGNTIAHNASAGVRVGAYNTDSTTVGIAIQQDRIYANGASGIVLSGEYLPDCATSETAANTSPNDYFDCPVINTAGTTTASGTAPANSTVEVFVASNDASSQYHGSGQIFLGTATADGSGNWTVTYNRTLTAGQLITATATGSGPSTTAPETSEYAENATVS